MNFAEVEKTINSLAVKANNGLISIDEMAGGTFTISNGGVYGSLLSTPIINPPQVKECLIMNWFYSQFAGEKPCCFIYDYTPKFSKIARAPSVLPKLVREVFKGHFWKVKGILVNIKLVRVMLNKFIGVLVFPIDYMHAELIFICSKHLICGLILCSPRFWVCIQSKRGQWL